MDEARFELIRAKRNRIRQLYGSLFDRVSGILFRLEDVRFEEEALDAIYEEFVGWFDPAITGPRDNYEDVAGEVWAVWREYKTARDGR